MGRASRRMHGRRELAFPPVPYIAVYQVKETPLKSRGYFTGRRTGLKSQEGVLETSNR